MATLIGFLAAAVIVVSLLSLFAIGLAAVMVAKSTVRANREDEALRADLDRVLAQILVSTSGN